MPGSYAWQRGARSRGTADELFAGASVLLRVIV
jgi:hypothetical protein